MKRLAWMGMTTATMAVMMATAGCSELVLQGFGAVVGPDCTVVEGSPGLSRGTLDVGATDRYQVIAKARTSKDADLAVTTAEIDLQMNVTAAQADALKVAAEGVGTAGFACDGVTCTLAGPEVVPAVMTEAGIVDDERVLLVSLDAVSKRTGQALQELIGEAQLLLGSDPLGTIELVTTVRLVADGGLISTPATMVVDLCDGCLAPSADRCASLGASVESLATDICIAGQDVASARCACIDGLEATADGCP